MIQKRGKSYGVSVYDPLVKRNVWVGTAGKLEDARRLERDKAAAFSKRRVRAGTVRAFSKLWFERFARQEATTNRHNRQMLKPFLEEFGDRKLDSIGRAEARAWAVQHRGNAKVVSAFFNDAIDAEAAESNPFSKLKLPQSRGRQDLVPLTPEQLAHLADSALPVMADHYGPVFRALVLFAGYSGLRPGELCGLTWKDIDFGKGEIHVVRQVRPDGSVALPKNRRERTVVLTPPAREALQSILPAGSPWLFPTVTGRRMNRGSMNYQWRRVTAQAGMPGVDMYEARHFFGSQLADMGLTARDIAEQMGNSPEVCERVYVHLYQDRSSDRIRRAFAENVTGIATHLARIEGGKAS